MTLNNAFPITEPKWGIDLLVSMNNYVLNDPFLTRIVPFFADVFVITYPIYLIYIYFYGIYKKNIEHKVAALYMLFSTILAIILNLAIQYVVDKQRPEQIAISKNNLIFKHVPDNPFPSDHAAVSAAIAMATLIRGIKNKSKGYIYFGIVLWIFSIIMCTARVAAGVHWPTDILVGMAVGIISALFMIWDNIFIIIKVKIFYPLIRLEKLIMRVFGIRQ